MLTRVLEVEAMDTAEEAQDYDAMDHSQVNQRFVAELLAAEPNPRSVVDVGCGTALIPIQLCRVHATCRVTATDLAERMLAVAAINVQNATLAQRITLQRVDAKRSTLPERSFDVVMSNSIIHHIPNPATAFAEMVRLCRPGGLIFVRDLERPADDAAVQHLVATYAAQDTPRQRALFDASLRAALTLDEIAALVAPLGIPARALARSSDRHWTLTHRMA